MKITDACAACSSSIYKGSSSLSFSSTARDSCNSAKWQNRTDGAVGPILTEYQGDVDVDICGSMGQVKCVGTQARGRLHEGEDCG